MKYFLATTFLASSLSAEPVVLQSTTSTQNSGLYDAILPTFTAETGIDVHVVAVGTGQALKNAQNCDGDLLIVHAKSAEEAFVASGYGTERTDLMYNDFIIVGPKDDPASIGLETSISGALDRISDMQFRFMSRGDDSGTHKAERRLWTLAEIDPDLGNGEWYLETGAGMGATINTARGLNAYVMTDRSTWIRFSNKGDFEIHFENDSALFNQYGIVSISPDHCPKANLEGASQLRNWLLSAEGQTKIAGYTIEGEQLFFPNAPDL